MNPVSSKQRDLQLPRHSTSTKSVLRSGAALIASGGRDEQKTFPESLTNEELRALPFLLEFWALPHQLPPESDWKTWVILGGRGAGKTRAGSEWVRSQVEGALPEAPGRLRRLAIVGQTYGEARDVMVHGESGILACTPLDRRPVWCAQERKLSWPNGAEAHVYSAHNYLALRGPQFDGAWVNELAKLSKAEEAWDMLQFSLRLGESPQQVVTTTPKNVPILKKIMAAPTTVITQASTEANRANLADSFLKEVQRVYGGTRLGRQELEGLLIENLDGALWTARMLSAAITDEVKPLDRVVVSVDPPVTGHDGSDECGIIVAGVTMQGAPVDWQVLVLEDASIKGASPHGWAEAAIAAMERHGAERMVVEVNQGGDMVEQIVRQVGGPIPFRGVRASRGKAARAEPAAALYEQGRVKHVRGLHKLEEQMGLMTIRGYQGPGSPDRVDALVWALTELVILPSQKWRMPRMRGLA